MSDLQKYYFFGYLSLQLLLLSLLSAQCFENISNRVIMANGLYGRMHRKASTFCSS